jgi:hypothetical protein
MSPVISSGALVPVELEPSSANRAGNVLSGWRNIVFRCISSKPFRFKKRTSRPRHKLCRPADNLPPPSKLRGIAIGVAIVLDSWGRTLYHAAMCAGEFLVSVVTDGEMPADV